MRNRIAQHVQKLQPSGIRRFFDLAANMEGVISLGVGEPDFVTSWGVREACIASLHNGHTSYTANAGLLELRKEISRYLVEQFEVEYRPETDVIVTVGASQALDLSIRAIVDPGDEVIVIEPCFVSYAPLIELVGGTAVKVGADEEKGFSIDFDVLESSITERTKAILLCFPNNPTGTMLSKDELIQVSRLVEKHDLLVLSDEIYAELSFDEKFTSFATLPGMKERTILISGFSKGFAMTGWRLGFVAGPTDIIEAMLKIHQYAMMCASTMAQYGAIEEIGRAHV